MEKKIGILGGGQLGRMLAVAGRAIGVEAKIVEEGANCSASYVTEVLQSSYSDIPKILSYLSDVDVVTYEFENIPQDLLAEISKSKAVYPPLRALEVSRHRGREKTFAQSLEIATPNFVLASSFQELISKSDQIKFPTIVKTCSEGYDGKGQWRFKTKTDLESFKIPEGIKQDLVAEEMISFDYEVSCIGVRSTTGELVFYPICENTHDHGILDYTKAPSNRVSEDIQAKAIEATKSILESLSYVGTIAVEYFVRGDELLFNEFAPRVHNSGHWTIEGSVASQFENHIRACLGMPLGSTESKGFSLMLNLLGTTGSKDELIKSSNVNYHWYDKVGLGDRRKVGHVTAVFKSEAAREQAFTDLKLLAK